jgi:hypothetical protein
MDNQTLTLCGVAGLRVPPIAELFYCEADEIYFRFPVYDYDIESTLVHIPEYSAGLLKKPRDMKALALIASYASTAWEIEAENIDTLDETCKQHRCAMTNCPRSTANGCSDVLKKKEAQQQAQLWRSVARKAGER